MCPAKHEDGSAGLRMSRIRTAYTYVTNYGAIGDWARTTPLAPVWALIADMVHVFKRHRITMLGRQAAYSLLYAIPSAMILIVSLANLIDRRLDSQLSETIVELIEDYAPESIKDLLISIVNEALIETSANQATIALIVSLGVATWGGAGGVGSLILACNVVYDVNDKRNYFVRQAMRLAMTVIQGVVFITSLILVAVGHQLADWLANYLGDDAWVVSMLDSPTGFVFALIFVSLFILYAKAPDVEMNYLWLLPGTAVAALALLGLLALADTLLGFINISSAYGLAGSVLVILWILYLVSVLIISGAVLNASVGGHYDNKLRAFLASNPDRRIIGRPTFGIPGMDERQESTKHL